MRASVRAPLGAEEGRMTCPWYWAGRSQCSSSIPTNQERVIGAGAFGLTSLRTARGKRECHQRLIQVYR